LFIIVKDHNLNSQLCQLVITILITFYQHFERERERERETESERARERERERERKTDREKNDSYLPGGGRSSGDVIDISMEAGGGGLRLYCDLM
jgi:hypothetical protein